MELHKAQPPSSAFGSSSCIPCYPACTKVTNELASKGLSRWTFWGGALWFVLYTLFLCGCWKRATNRLRSLLPERAQDSSKLLIPCMLTSHDSFHIRHRTTYRCNKQGAPASFLSLHSMEGTLHKLVVKKPTIKWSCSSFWPVCVRHFPLPGLSLRKWLHHVRVAWKGWKQV